ncbi:MAG: carbon-nitrogen hydrolase family protein [Pseudomonadota bacterium]
MADLLNIACLQTRPMPTFEAALGEALPLATRAVEEGANLLSLPEYCGGLVSDGPRLVPPRAAEAAHLVLTELRGFASTHGVWIQIGSIAVEGPQGKIWNRGYLVGPQGQIAGRYDKIHLFDIQLSEQEVYRESDSVAPGTEAVLHDMAGVGLGHTICYDLRFPQLYRDLAQAGAQILTCPAAFTQKTGEAHWHVLNRARAIENGAFMVSACAHGAIPGGGAAYGHSLIIDPWGKVLADGGEGAGVISAKIDLAQVAETRARIPSLQHDRAFSLVTDERDIA